MTQIPDHENYNCKVVTDCGKIRHIYANWMHNHDLDHWQGWTCHAGNTRLYIDKDLQVWSGECRNDLLGSAVNGFEMLESTTCLRETCTGCTDDLMVAKSSPRSSIGDSE